MGNKRNFMHWFETFRETINSYSYYTDFEKVYENVDKFKIEINILNSLIGSKNIQNDFISILKNYPKCINVIPILLAVRSNEIYCQDEKGGLVYKFNKQAMSVEQYCYFMQKTGLFSLISEHLINNLYDYITGVEVGLDSNGRKNRGGSQMENLVERYIKQTNVEYYREMYLSDIENRWDIDLSIISGDGTSTKRWDFVVISNNIIYVIETNFYSSSGSKLNETARSYKFIAEKASAIPRFNFIWITDGGGWKSARKNLEDTFNSLDNLYNIKDMEMGIFKKLFDT